MSNYKGNNIPTKLTEQDVIAIMQDQTSTEKVLAQKYNVSEGYLGNIKRGLKWKHITCNPQYARTSKSEVKKNSAKKLTEQAVIDILTDTKASAKELAARHNVNVCQIYQIHKGKTWRHVSKHYTLRNLRDEVKSRKKLNVDIVTAIKHNAITDLEAVAKEYNVTVKHLKKLRNPNYIDCWKTIRVKVA